jgi:hypothetical protein
VLINCSGQVDTIFDRMSFDTSRYFQTSSRVPIVPTIEYILSITVTTISSDHTDH